jgi:hypothetical protein
MYNQAPALASSVMWHTVPSVCERVQELLTTLVNNHSLYLNSNYFSPFFTQFQPQPWENMVRVLCAQFWITRLNTGGWKFTPFPTLVADSATEKNNIKCKNIYQVLTQLTATAFILYSVNFTITSYKPSLQWLADRLCVWRLHARTGSWVGFVSR